jgi:hypothetical protein
MQGKEQLAVASCVKKESKIKRTWALGLLGSAIWLDLWYYLDRT